LLPSRYSAASSYAEPVKLHGEVNGAGRVSSAGIGKPGSVGRGVVSIEPGAIDSDILIDWYARTARDLPWRRPGVSAWQILMSEIMLQQTPVSRVEPIWREWVRRWPVPSAMAAASAGEVLRAWGKLGYPRRALRLHECAQVLAAEHGDQVPDDVEVLLGLPGIGAYTARAVACFAYGQRVPVVDTNVRRVVARAVHGREAGNPAARDLRETEALLPGRTDRAAVFSAALMELGATVCTARTPDCTRCPLPRCAWVTAGRPVAESTRRTQKYEGTDRQARGRLLDVLRAAHAPVERVRLDLAWTRDPGQRDRALDSLLVDGLIEQTDDGRFALAGEG
jgi:A/G-specific adenine glycosylase